MPVVPVERPSGVPERGFQTLWRMATADYLKTLRVPLLRGRMYDRSDSGKAAILLSQSVVRRLWPDGTDPLERQVRLGNGRVYTVVGILGDARVSQLNIDPLPVMYMEPFFWANLSLVVRTQGNPMTLVPSLREVIRRLDPLLPLGNIRTVEAVVERSTARPYLQAVLFTSFAVIALLLGAVGVAGVVSHTVERRASELAIRLALGARPGHAMRSVAQSGLAATAAGLVIGLAGAWGLGRFLSALLFQVSADDLPTFVGVGAALAVVAVLACWLPAMRAARVNPIVALRSE
jgi:hypothetical protein